MNKIFTQNDSPMLFEIVEELHQLLIDSNDQYSQNAQTIYIAPLTQVRNSLLIWERLISSGFASNISNYTYNNDCVRLIILNIEDCNNAQISKDEFKALILHELGHLLNCPIYENIPTP